MYYLEHHCSSQDDYTAEADINLSKRSDRPSTPADHSHVASQRPNYWNLLCLTLL